MECLKFYFHENKNRSDGINSWRKNCMKNFFSEINNRIRDKSRNYSLNNREMKKEYYIKSRDKSIEYRKQYRKNRLETDVNVRIVCNT